MSGGDRDLDRDLHATTQDIREDATALDRLERSKDALSASDPRAAELAAKAEEVAGRIARKASAERSLTKKAGREG